MLKKSADQLSHVQWWGTDKTFIEHIDMIMTTSSKMTGCRAQVEGPQQERESYQLCMRQLFHTWHCMQKLQFSWLRQLQAKATRKRVTTIWSKPKHWFLLWHWHAVVCSQLRPCHRMSQTLEKSVLDILTKVKALTVASIVNQVVKVFAAEKLGSVISEMALWVTPHLSLHSIDHHFSFLQCLANWAACVVMQLCNKDVEKTTIAIIWPSIRKLKINGSSQVLHPSVLQVRALT